MQLDVHNLGIRKSFQEHPYTCRDVIDTPCQFLSSQTIFEAQKPQNNFSKLDTSFLSASG